MTTVEMADVYRSLVMNLKDKLGGTINDANADAIAHAAAQVYRREVEPRMWEEKSAHELLDSLGVPRSGAFVPYSLSDRLLVLRRRDAEDPYRAQAHELLDELGVPRLDGEGREHPLQVRLTHLLGSLDGVPGVPPAGGGEGAGGGTNGPEPATEGEAKAGSDGAQEPAAGADLVDALEAIQKAVGPAGSEDASSSPPPASTSPPSPAASNSPPAPELIGFGSLLGSIQEELVKVRQVVESLKQELRDAVALFQAGGGPGPRPPVVPDAALPDGGQEVVVRRTGDGPEPAAAAESSPPEVGAPGTGPVFVAPDSGSPDGEGGDAGPSDTDVATPLPLDAPEADGAPDEPEHSGPVGPHEPTRVLPPVPATTDGPAFAEETEAEEPAVSRRRSRRVALLILLVILIGVLLAAGITAAVVLGWDEMQSRFLDMVTVPVWSGSTATP